MIMKYFYESEKRNMYYESDDKYEVADWLIQEAQERNTPAQIELYNEILAIIAEKYVNEVEED